MSKAEQRRFRATCNKLQEKTRRDDQGRRKMAFNRCLKKRLFLSLKYLQESGFLLFIKLLFQNIPQPVDYSVVAMVAAVISCVSPVMFRKRKKGT